MTPRGPHHWRDQLELVNEVCEKTGRDPDEVETLPVTKGFDTGVIESCWDFGFRAFGENRVREYLNKIEELGEKPAVEAGWHMIGHLQSNKVRKVIDEFELVHSVDRESLINEFDKRLSRVESTQEVLLQVNVSGEESKHGASPEEAPELLGKMTESSQLSVEGLMTMAPWTDDTTVLTETFASCRRLRDRLENEFETQLPELSMGMTNDYEVAIKEGATILRLGRFLFGER